VFWDPPELDIGQHRKGDAIRERLAGPSSAVQLQVPWSWSWPSISEPCDRSFIFDEHDVVVVAAGTTKHQGSRIEDKGIRHHCLEIIGGKPCDITDHGH